MKRMLALLMCLVLTMGLGSALASEAHSGTLQILPEVFPVDPQGSPPPTCNHRFGETNPIDTLTVDLDDPAYCYMQIAISAKTCEACGITAYDVDTELIPHEGTEALCTRCGKHLVPPVIAVPLGQ